MIQKMFSESKRFYQTSELNDYSVKLYSLTFKFRKLMQQQIWDEAADCIVAFPQFISKCKSVRIFLT